MKIGIIVAMDKELQQLRPLFPEDQVILQKSGIGKVNAAIQTVEMIRQYKPDCIISTGCAGGNGDDINVQDVVVSTQLAYHDVYCGEAIGHSVYGQVQGLPARYDADGPPRYRQERPQELERVHLLQPHQGFQTKNSNRIKKKSLRAAETFLFFSMPD